MADKEKNTKEPQAEKGASEENESIRNDSLTAEKEVQADSIKEMEARIQALEEEAKQAHERLLRTSAEFENYKKRAAREMEDFRKYANEALIKELLPVVDNLERAITSSREDKSSTHCVVEGVDLTLKEILKILEKFKVTPIDSFQKPFDPNFHQAVMQEETDVHPEGTVVKELQKGYLMHDRLIRPAMVVVAKAQSDVNANNE